MHFTVGPSQTYPTVVSHVQEAMKQNLFSLSHRGDTFKSIFGDTCGALRSLLDIPGEYQIFFTGSATEGMEKVIQNCVETKSFHFINGSFSKRVFDIATALKKQPEKFDAGFGQPFTDVGVEIPADTELLCFTHNETSAGVQTPMEYIYQVAAARPEMLVAIDVVSSVPCIDIDFAKLDAVFFSVQKGFGLPAGLGVLVVSPRAMEKARTLNEKGINIGSYHNFLNLHTYASDNQTLETPNTLLIYLLGKVAKDIQDAGIDEARKRLAHQAVLLYDFFDNSSQFTPFVTDPVFRSVTTPVIATKGDAAAVMAHLQKEGMYVTAGYGEHKNSHIRIGNFLAHQTEDIKKLIDVLSRFDQGSYSVS